MVSNVTAEFMPQVQAAPSGTKTAPDSKDSFQNALKDAVKGNEKPADTKTDKPEQSQDKAPEGESAENAEQTIANQNLLLFLAGFPVNPETQIVQPQAAETAQQFAAAEEIDQTAEAAVITGEAAGEAAASGEEDAETAPLQDNGFAKAAEMKQGKTELPKGQQPVENLQTETETIRPVKTEEHAQAEAGTVSEKQPDNKLNSTAQPKENVRAEDKPATAAETVNVVSKPESRMESVPVKAPEGAAQEGAAQEGPAELKTTNLVEDQILPQIKAGKQDFTIQLEPESLGKLVIKATCENGQTSISIFCTSEKTLHLLASRAGELGSIMENNLGTPTQVFVDKSEENYLNQGHNDQGGNGKQQEQEQHQEKGKDGGKNDKPDFLQQLRLGLV